MKACLEVCAKCKHFKKTAYNLFIQRGDVFYILSQYNCMLGAENVLGQTVLARWYDGRIQPKDDIPDNCVFQLEHMVGL